MAQATKGSLKLAHILDELNLDPTNFECADLGCNVGGFTRELLARGARLVHAIDTGYGTLEWDLRQNPQVDVKERRNALHADWLTPQDLVVSDCAWTKQIHVISAAQRYLKPSGILISLLKPQYEAPTPRGKKAAILSPETCREIALQVHEELQQKFSFQCSLHDSPIRGGQNYQGNTEFWIVYRPPEIAA
jgi:23S rRNA (cytidine1920-2'-O)/16S rRNA (cytidine1409-2'-O)-methyltransferase